MEQNQKPIDTTCADIFRQASPLKGEPERIPARMEYDILLDNVDVYDLIDAVNEAIADGWTPLGGVAVSRFEDSDGYSRQCYNQAMIRETEAK